VQDSNIYLKIKTGMAMQDAAVQVSRTLIGLRTIRMMSNLEGEILVRLAGIEPTTLGFGGSLDDYENWLILL
jgi:hypothetical protein